jgi:hypothetical protein
MLRRALILNSMAEKHAISKTASRFDIDPGVIRAFLAVPKYEHGARSMEAIIQMGRRRRGEPYKRSSLPSEAQLSLHVDARTFLQRMREYGR